MTVVASLLRFYLCCCFSKADPKADPKTDSKTDKEGPFSPSSEAPHIE